MKLELVIFFVIIFLAILFLVIVVQRDPRCAEGHKKVRMNRRIREENEPGKRVYCCPICGRRVVKNLNF